MGEDRAAFRDHFESAIILGEAEVPRLDRHRVGDFDQPLRRRRLTGQVAPHPGGVGDAGMGEETHQRLLRDRLAGRLPMLAAFYE